jgi:hypothetical protein
MAVDTPYRKFHHQPREQAIRDAGDGLLLRP